MKLKDLVGEHILDAVDFDSTEVNRWGDLEDSQVCRFRLDGNTYVAIEDPSDGYRSSMDEIRIDKKSSMKNIFGGVAVVGVHRTTGSYGDKNDVLELIDIKTGGVVLEVGTDSVDDYYPSFVARFHPQNLTATTTSYHIRTCGRRK